MTALNQHPAARRRGLAMPVNSTLAAWLLVAALFLSSLLAGFYASFPHSVLRQRLIAGIEQQLPIQISVDDLRLLPPMNLRGSRAELSFTDMPGYRLDLESLRIGPWWASLFSADPGLTGRAEVAGGTISLQMRKSGRLVAGISGATLELPLSTTPPLFLAGKVTSARLESTVPLPQTGESRLTVEAEQLVLRGLTLAASAEGGLPLGRLQLQAIGQGRSFRIERFETAGGALEVTATGTLLLAAELSGSRLNLNLVVRAGSAAGDDLVSLLELAGPRQTDGSYRVRLTGTLANPVIK